jgi:hypothetical protein
MMTPGALSLISIVDVAEARLKDGRVSDPRVRADLREVAKLARIALAELGERHPDDEKTKPDTPVAKKSSSEMQAVHHPLEGHAERVSELLKPDR